MSRLVIKFDSIGDITDWWYEPADDYEPGSGELVPDPEPDHRDLVGMVVDTSTDPPTLVEAEDKEWRHPSVIVDRTLEILTEQFLEAGGNALTADAAIQANTNIPQEVKDMNRATIQMFYLLYVGLTGERIDAVEADYFPVE